MWLPKKRASVLPGFGLALGFTVTYLRLIVLIPLSAIFVKAPELGWEGFWAAVTTPRVVASYRLSLRASLTAAIISAVFGLIVAWVLVRYPFPGRRLVDALVDLPFALPTAVAGIALTTLYGPNGWLGARLAPLGIKVAFTPLGIVVALTFIGLPFVIRTLQPVLEDLEADVEEAAASLGREPLGYVPARDLARDPAGADHGFALAFARAVGEYGSVVFISGNMPMRTEIAPLLIMTKLEQFDYAGASAIAVVLLVISFTLLVIINFLSSRNRLAGGTD